MPAEEWRPIPGYEGLYEVSDLGRIRSLDRYCLGRDGRNEFHAGKILWAGPTKRGYAVVGLRDGKVKHTRTVHSIVAEVFLGPRPAKHDVMHLNGDRLDNRASNLRYGTRAENLHQTYEYGGRAANGKLTREQAIDAITRMERGESPLALAEEYGVNSAAMYHIRNGTTFKWLRQEVFG